MGGGETMVEVLPGLARSERPEHGWKQRRRLGLKAPRRLADVMPAGEAGAHGAKGLGRDAEQVSLAPQPLRRLRLQRQRCGGHVKRMMRKRLSGWRRLGPVGLGPEGIREHLNSLSLIAISK